MAETSPQTVATLVHPNYDALSIDWMKWRLVYEGGRNFKIKYLKQFSAREDNPDYADRLDYTYAPTFAKGALNDVKNSIYGRMVDIVRVGGSPAYQSKVEGDNGGVDGSGISMNTFIGQKVLPELLTMGRVGVYVDMPANLGPTLYDNVNKTPYLYTYKAEDIRSWVFNRECKLTAVLLQDCNYSYDKETGLPDGDVVTYRRLWIGQDGLVHVIIYDDEGKQATDEIVLQLTKIPFVWLELTESLLVDIADYQIAMLNLASSNIQYALKSNFPFYVEQYDPRTDNSYVRPVTFDSETEGTEEAASTSTQKEIKVGVTQGRRYPKELAAPSFINPSPEPLDVSMRLMDKMKEETRQLLNLTLASLEPKFASAESKDKDQLGLESGLSNIGLVLENGEAEIATLWAMYERSGKSATVNYPNRYSLKSDKDRRDEAKELKDLRGAIPSRSGQKELSKQIADVLLSHRVTHDMLVKINKEIDGSSYATTDAKEIQIDVEAGLVSLKTASEARGYNPDEVEQAKKDHADRLARIAESQAELSAMKNADAQGIQDMAGNPGQDAKNQKKVNNQDPTQSQRKRGEGD